MSAIIAACVGKRVTSCVVLLSLKQQCVVLLQRYIQPAEEVRVKCFMTVTVTDSSCTCRHLGRRRHVGGVGGQATYGSARHLGMGAQAIK